MKEIWATDEKFFHRAISRDRALGTRGLTFIFGEYIFCVQPVSYPHPWCMDIKHLMLKATVAISAYGYSSATREIPA